MANDSIVEDDSVVEQLPRSIDDEVDYFFGGCLHEDWQYLYDREEESIANYLRKRPLLDIERALRALDDILRRGHSEEQMAHFLGRVIHCGYYPPGVGKTYIEWFQWVRDEVARGVEHKKRACQSLSERADSQVIVPRLIEGEPREKRDRTFQHLADCMRQMFFRNWRRTYKDTDEIIEELVADLPTEQLAMVLGELNAFLLRRYTEDELEYLVHTVLECCQFDPIPGATYTESLEWTRDRLRAALDRKRATVGEDKPGGTPESTS